VDAVVLLVPPSRILMLNLAEHHAQAPELLPAMTKTLLPLELVEELPQLRNLNPQKPPFRPLGFVVERELLLLLLLRNLKPRTLKLPRQLLRRVVVECLAVNLKRKTKTNQLNVAVDKRKPKMTMRMRNPKSLHAKVTPLVPLQGNPRMRTKMKMTTSRKRSLISPRLQSVAR
jgi:hypothetical protein